MIVRLDCARWDLHTSNTAWISYGTESATARSGRCSSLRGMIDAALLETEISFQKHIKQCTKRHAACAYLFSASALWFVAWQWCGAPCRRVHLETLFRPTFPGHGIPDVSLDKMASGSESGSLNEWFECLWDVMRLVVGCKKPNGLSRCGW
jgi:hypothetical protein